ncbi:PREDICTED: ammonium transporter Rh type B-B-like isoform X1 [Thamnophis sirtalis]|uniref:Ammonium transporter Rh type B-B-like isoform X1 n=1 Tax=Thamnophis sirtalis TaxID=35019 RepID=A0A6I9YSN6_9SAUR|nr:PREDICTED: ammonium transporter Rh type B-B-like isoform X1 [Thamnophis sirtalis]
MSGHPTNLRVKLPLLCALLQLATVLLFAFFVQYDSHTSPRLWHEDVQLHSKGPLDHEFYPRYPSFQDVHVMVFLGFGFLMTFLKRYSFGGVAFNFLIAAFALQWSVLIQGFFHTFHNGKIHVGIESMINADFCAGSVLISFGALLGKTSPVQLLLMAGLEVTLFGINEYVLLSLLQVSCSLWGADPSSLGTGWAQGKRPLSKVNPFKPPLSLHYGIGQAGEAQNDAGSSESRK